MENYKKPIAELIDFKSEFIMDDEVGAGGKVSVEEEVGGKDDF